MSCSSSSVLDSIAGSSPTIVNNILTTNGSSTEVPCTAVSPSTQIREIAEYPSEIYARFPLDFLKQISQNNKERAANAPNALFLGAEFDDNGMMHRRALLFFLLSVSKTHRINIRMIGLKNEIREAVGEARDLYNRPVDLLILNAHGRDSQIMLSEREGHLEKSDIKPGDFEGLASEAEIFLVSCEAGAGGENSFAKTVADVADRSVFAAPSTISGSDLRFYFCKKHKIFEMAAFQNQKQCMSKFQKGCPSVSSDCPKDVSSLYCSDMMQYITSCPDLSSGDWLSLPSLINESNDKALKAFFQKATDNKEQADAQYCLGVFYQQKEDYEKAEIWFQKAAEQGRWFSQNSLAYLLYKKHEYKKAEFWLKKVVAQEDSYEIAEYNLGFLYEKLQELENAKIWYKKALDHGYKKAGQKLEKLSKEEQNLIPVATTTLCSSIFHCLCCLCCCS